MKKILFGLLLLIASVARAQTFPVNNLTVAGSAIFASRPLFNGQTPWDTGNLPSPVSLSSPVFTGTPTAPTPVQGSNTTQIATTSYVVQHSPCPSIVDYGGDPTGANDNSTAWTSTLAASPSGNKCVFFPAGNFKFTSPISYTMTGAVESVTVLGAGADRTVLTFGATSGLTLNYINAFSSAHVRDLSITTTANGGAAGLTLHQNATSLPNPALSAISDITGVVLRGADGYVISNFWSTGISLFGVSNVNFINDGLFGNAAFGGAGTGVTIAGTSLLNPAQFNFTSCVFDWNIVGINYGNFTQGVSVSQSNFVGGTEGIAAQVGVTNPDQLTVTGSQFNVTAVAIVEAVNVPNTMIYGNQFIVQTNGIGISLPAAGIYSIIANTFVKNGGASNVNGIVINNSTSPGVVSGNVFLNLTTAVNLQAGSTTANVQANSYVGNSNNVVNAGAGNSVGLATQ